MSPFWTTKRIAETLGLPLQNESRAITEITTDSRQVKPGSVFVAIQGDTHDGHKFIPQAIEAGAAAIISEHAAPHPKGEFFHVPSTMAAIRSLAHAYRKSFNIPVIGVVGAVGKTTTKELLTSVLSGKYIHVAKTIGSQNGFLGIPITLLSLPAEAQVAIIEIGIDDIGAMVRHMDLVEPTHVILTKTGPEHLHQLKTIEIAAEEELKAFDYARDRKLNIAVNLSDSYVADWFEKNHNKLCESQIHTYSLEKSKMPEILGHYEAEKNELTVQSEKIKASFTVPLPGEHHAHNLLAALSMTEFFDLSVSEIRSGIATFKTAFGRTEIYVLPNGVEIIGDYYNSNPTSLEAALNLLASKRGMDQYHAVLGDMLELGTAEETFHRDAADFVVSNGVTHVWLYGDRMKWLEDELEKRDFKNVHHFASHDLLSKQLKGCVKNFSRVLIKGSRGMRMEKVLEVFVPKGSAH